MCSCLSLLLLTLAAASALNDRPIIGILTQENEGEMADVFPGWHSYIAASYVKYLEGSGARAVPVWTNQSSAYYESVVDYLNGLLIPGGEASFSSTGGYFQAGWQLYNLAIQKNEAGVHFPIWGTSLGFELLVVVSANGTDLRTVCDVQNVTLPLEFTQDFRNSSLFGKDIYGITNILEHQNVTINFHHWCITEQNLTAAGGLDQWHILSLNEYGDSGKFVSTVEHRKYPFYGVQFHPEKNIFEWGEDLNIPHSTDAILVSQFFANFFVDEARRNHNHLREENQYLIYRYNATHTGGQYSHFEQVYFFQEDESILLPTTTTTTTTTTSTTTTTTTTTPRTTTENTEASQEAVRASASQVRSARFYELFMLFVLAVLVQKDKLK